MKELIKIQRELKAPKNQRNNFGNYMYRSCEDILEALKPHLEANNCLLTITDEIVSINSVEKVAIKDKNGGVVGYDEATIRTYIKATATIINAEGKSVNTTAFAREPITKKGMDESQLSGAASSYARKYALNGLFLIDDTKDADTTNKSEKISDEDRWNGAMKLLGGAKTIKDITKVWNENPDFQGNENFINACKEAKTKVKKK